MFFSKKKKETEQPAKAEKVDIKALVNDLINSFEQEKQTIIGKALQIDNHFNNEWDEYLASWNLAPRTLADRQDDIENGISIQKGALPIEVREVFVVLKEKYEGICRQIRNNYEEILREEDEAEERLWEFENRTLSDFVESETKKYIKKVKKTSNTLDEALKNAEQNKNQWSSNLQEAKSYMIRCKNCGAARLHANQYDNCKFCGSELFEKIEK